jgi:signal peptidase
MPPTTTTVPASTAPHRATPHAARRKPTRRLAANVGYLLLALLIAVLMVRTFVLHKPLQLPLEPRAEMSDSMAPLLNAGDLLFLKHTRASDVHVGDVVAFADPEGTGKTIIHRAIAIHPASNGELRFVTRGDANGTSVERWRVGRDGQVGVLAAHVPLLGRVSLWLQDLGGRTLLLIASAMLTVIALVRIWRPEHEDTQP